MVERTLDVIEAFSLRRTPLLLTELAEQIGAPKSSCFEAVRALKRRGYLYALGRRRGFYPTRRLYAHAQVIAANDPALRRLEERLSNLRDATGETVIVGKMQDDAVVYLDVVESRHSIRYSAMPGDQKPLHSSAIGKAFLGEQTERQLAEVMERLPLEKVTEATLVKHDAVLADIAAGRSRGYFVTRGENVEDVMALASVIELSGESYGIAVAGPMHRMQPNEARLAADLLNAIKDMELGA